MITFVLVVGLLAGITGWNNPNPETSLMCRTVGLAAAGMALFLWWPW